jgi:hypothetical protein
MKKHLKDFQYISRKAKKKIRLSTKIFGGNMKTKNRPNYNGTSGNFRDTLSKPCPVPSQIFLNDLRRSK